MHDARRRGGDAVRYLALPQPDRTTVIISTAAEGEPVGRDRANIYGLLWRWLETPDGKRQSTSRDGWGGPWQGTQGDGRNRAQTRARHAEQKEQHAGHCLHCDADLPPGRVYCDAECRAAYGEAQRKAAGVVQRWTARPVAEVARALKLVLEVASALRLEQRLEVETCLVDQTEHWVIRFLERAGVRSPLECFNIVTAPHLVVFVEVQKPRNPPMKDIVVDV